MEASSLAYGSDGLYRRTCVLVDHAESGSYLIDVFRAAGGTKREYVFHGPGERYEIEGLAPAAAPRFSSGDSAASGEGVPLEDPRQAHGESAWSITWTLTDGYQFHALVPGTPGETVTVGNGWGQRDHRNTDRGATLPYVVRRREGKSGTDLFVSVFAGNQADRRLVQSVRLLPLDGENRSDAVAVAIATSAGTDVVISMTDPGPVRVSLDGAEIATDGRLAAVLAANDGNPSWACLVGGRQLTAPGVQLKLPVALFEGRVVDTQSDSGASCFTIEGPLPEDDLVGRTFFAIDEHFRRAYPISAIQRTGELTRVFTKQANRGFEARPAQRYEVIPSAVWPVAK
jgi:hypothetical protein